jgi:hypothetical protein
MSEAQSADKKGGPQQTPAKTIPSGGSGTESAREQAEKNPSNSGAESGSVVSASPQTAATAGAPAQAKAGAGPAVAVDLVKGTKAEGRDAAAAGAAPGGATAQMVADEIPDVVGEQDDALLDCLELLTEIHGNPMSGEALKAGLPLADGFLTPALFIRAAERACLAARAVKRNLKGIMPLTLPCVLLLADRRACILNKFIGKDRFEVILPESGAGVTELGIDDLAKVYTGNAIFVRPEYRYDSRTETLSAPRRKAWFWGTIASSWRVYAEVVLAALLVNTFALASPLFIMNVYDRVVPNQAIETMWVLAIGVATVFGFDFVLRTLRGYFVDVAGKKADVLISSRPQAGHWRVSCANSRRFATFSPRPPW